MFVMVFVEHILWGGDCIQRQKNTGMIGVSFSKSVSKVRINVWDGVSFYLSTPEDGQKTRLSESASVDVNFFKI